MFISKLSIPRRTFLRGMGAAVALPLLDAMVPAATAIAQTPGRPLMRFGAIYVPHGAIMDRWTPATSGRMFEFTPTLKALEPYRKSLVVISNLARAGTTVGDHAVAPSGWLTGALAKQTEAEDVRVGTTIDQVVAKQIGQETPLPSLELATEDFTGYIGGCTPAFSCTYMNTISWATPTTPLPMEINPRVVFERLFGRAGTHAQRLARMQEDRSILDAISHDLSDLERGLGAGDRTRVRDYLDTVREIERRIQRTEAAQQTDLATIDAPIGIPDSFGDHASIMFDLLTVAYQADIARVFTFMMAREASQRTYPQLDLREPWHTLSHHGHNPEKIAQNARINEYYVHLFARFVQKLAAISDGDGSLLEHVLLFYGSGMSDGDSHATDPLPLLAVGGGAGQGHRHIVAAERTPIGNLWLGVAHKFDSRVDTFGESTGVMEI
ncbi:MAG: hypothetical protein C5B57_05335 [Blastocatellia bacterium]|nr:MAG: hypothetical protein C5B57_05335 [Blastocatellia bacterium]